MVTTIGTLDPPLGRVRLHIVWLISASVATNNARINKDLADLGTINVILVSITDNLNVVFLLNDAVPNSSASMRTVIVFFLSRTYFLNINGIIFYIRTLSIVLAQFYRAMLEAKKETMTIHF